MAGAGLASPARCRMESCEKYEGRAQRADFLEARSRPSGMATSANLWFGVSVGGVNQVLAAGVAVGPVAAAVEFAGAAAAGSTVPVMGDGLDLRAGFRSSANKQT